MSINICHSCNNQGWFTITQCVLCGVSVHRIDLSILIVLNCSVFLFLSGHVSEEDSLFSYGDQNYSALNNDYLDFIPTFFDELNITQEVMDACGDNQACILDASVTGNVNIGTSTLQEEKESEELGAILGKIGSSLTTACVQSKDAM